MSAVLAVFGGVARGHVRRLRSRTKEQVSRSGGSGRVRGNQGVMGVWCLAFRTKETQRRPSRSMRRGMGKERVPLGEARERRRGKIRGRCLSGKPVSWLSRIRYLSGRLSILGYSQDSRPSSETRSGPFCPYLVSKDPGVNWVIW